ncbi:hypothetical protein MesoLj131c_73390 (plasmid) [Mesorhizobium sp. 131-3-5]|nr:hypothetical protein MesoLj131c_69230 [Mesorhizobium sp. 131-3-5]BCH13081.1 hypothetical protein MesoLj131c_73390 [Mesorhizobium sp. 131-3-5]
MGTLDGDISAHLLEQSSGNKYLATAIALGQSIGQFEPDLTAWWLTNDSKIGCEEK